jgi:hypothetical protein
LDGGNFDRARVDVRLQNIEMPLVDHV